MIFIDNSEHHKFLLGEIDKSPDSVFITSFGVYLGILHDGSDTTQWGHKYSNDSRLIAERLRSIDNVRILVGLSDYNSCKGKRQCLDCEAQYSKNLIRLLNHVEVFSEFSWRMMHNLHLKCSLFDFDGHFSGTAGGRNFTGSSWSDLTLSLSHDDCSIIMNNIWESWEIAPNVDMENITKVLESQGISEEGFQRVSRI